MKKYTDQLAEIIFRFFQKKDQRHGDVEVKALPLYTRNVRTSDRQEKPSRP